MQKYKISIIIPIYNMEKYLKKCLDSVINQTYQDIEIICVNDGSTDSSTTILNEYAINDPRILIINKKNEGLSSARNAGLKMATSEYIAFVDADDWIEKNTYEQLIKIIKKENVDLVIHRFKRIYDDYSQRSDSDSFFDNKYSCPEGKHIVDDKIISKFFITSWNKLYKKSIITNNNIQFPEHLIFEDWVFYWKYIVNCTEIFSVNNTFYNYRQRNNSIMSSIYSSDGGSIKTLDYLKTAEIVYNYLNESANFHKYYEAFWDYYLLIYDNAYYFISPEYKHLVKQSAYKFIKEIKNISNSDYLKSNNFKKLENIIY